LAEVEAAGSGARSAPGVAARRYALAVFELAQEDGSLAAWQAALDEIAAFMAEPDIGRVLSNSRVDQETKQRLIELGLPNLPQKPLNLARLLARKGRTGLTRDIATYFRQLAEVQAGISRAHAVTAVEMNDAARAALIARLGQETGRQIILDTDVDPRLIGGIRVQIGDRLIDASTRARLQALREALT
jgi:F-type H+-transporting ATPase subunit delta